MFALTVAALTIAAPAQVSAPPTTGPNGNPLEILDVETFGPTSKVVARAPSVFSPGPALIYDLDAGGQLHLVDGIRPDGVLSAHSHVALGADRILMGAYGDSVYALERGPDGWQRRGAALPSLHIGGQEQIVPTRADLEVSGRTGAYRDGTGQLRLYDLTDLLQMSLELQLTPAAGSFISGFELDGDTLVVATTIGPAGTLTNSALRVYERTAGAWNSGTDLVPPAGGDWDLSFTEMSLDGDTLAVVGQGQSGVDDCRVIYIYERSQGGLFTASDILRPSGTCSQRAVYGTDLSSPSLAGDLLVLFRRFDLSCDRFRRTATGWIELDPARNSASTKLNTYRAAGPFTVASGGNGLEAFDDSPNGAKGVTFLCDSAVAFPNSSVLYPTPRPSIDLGNRSLEWFATGSPLGPLQGILLVGLQPASVQIGPESILCIRPALRIPVMLGQTPSSASDALHRARAIAQRSSLGVPVGTTLYYQGWTPHPGVPAGRTSSAAAVTF